MKRLTTRGIATAQAIRDREDFRTNGALYGESTSVGRYDAGRLQGDDLNRFYADAPEITYVVMSYATPIAWYVPASDTRPEGVWHKVAQKFSVTTTKHQGNLYLI